MADLREQRVCIKLCIKLEKTAAEMHQMLKQAFGDNSLGETQTYDWYKHFKNGRASTDDDDHPGRPSTGTTPENVSKVRDLILQHHLPSSPLGSVYTDPIISATFEMHPGSLSLLGCSTISVSA